MEKIYSSVGVLTTIHGEELYGMAIAWVFQVSFDPLLIAAGVGKNRRTLRGIEAAGRFAVSLMPEDQTDVVLKFGSKQKDKFSGVSYQLHDGMPLIDGAIEHIIADVIDMVKTGDHIMVIGRVIYDKVLQDKYPIVYGEDGLIFIKKADIKRF